MVPMYEGFLRASGIYVKELIPGTGYVPLILDSVKLGHVK